MKRIPKTVNLDGCFADQKGKAKRGGITGHNSYGIACRKYTWIEPEQASLKGQTFEAFDDQILNTLREVGK